MSLGILYIQVFTELSTDIYYLVFIYKQNPFLLNL